MRSFSRAGGILLHPSSLPGPYGIGDLGPQAYQFVDWLVSTGCRLWQVLPLGPTGYGDSPYQCFSAFAGNPYLISFDALIEDGLLSPTDFEVMPEFDRSRVDYGQLIPWKLDLLQRAFSRLASASKNIGDDFKQFCDDNASWLDDYALFMSVKEAAFYLKVSKSFLDKLRVNGGGPEFVRLSARKILYRRSDLDSWARQRRFESTAQYPGLK